MILKRQKIYSFSDFKVKDRKDIIIPRQQNYSISDKLKSSIDKNEEDLFRSHTNEILSRRKTDPNEEIKLIRKLRKIGKNEGRSKITGIYRIPNTNIPLDKKTAHFRNLIYYDPSVGAGGLAHEIGHSLERENGSLVGRLVDKTSNMARQSIKKATPEEKGMLLSAKRYIQGKLINANERRATKRGIALLKRVGASKEAVDVHTKELQHSLETYINKNKILYKKPIYNLIKR